MGFNLGRAAIGGIAGGFLGGPAGAAFGAGLLGGSGGSGGGPGGIAAPQMPKFAMRRTEEFMKPESSIQIGGPNAASAMSRRFNNLRQSAQNRIQASNTDASNAIARKFASQGMSGSGAEIRAMEQLNEQQAQQQAEAMNQIDAQETEQLANRDLAQADMDFKNKVFSFDKASKMHELDLTERQQQIDAVAQQYNANLSAEMARPPKKGLLSGILDGLL